MLAIDPASQKTGWAVLSTDDVLCPALLDAGLIVAKSSLSFSVRLKQIVCQVITVENKYRPDMIILEVSTRPQRWSGKRRSGANVGAYHLAAGVIWGTLTMVHGWARVEVIEANVWTRGRRKAVRMDTVRALYPEYDWRSDRGYDVADAIGLGLWWIDHRLSPKACRDA